MKTRTAFFNSETSVMQYFIISCKTLTSVTLALCCAEQHLSCPQKFQLQLISGFFSIFDYLCLHQHCERILPLRFLRLSSGLDLLCWRTSVVQWELLLYHGRWHEVHKTGTSEPLIWATSVLKQFCKTLQVLLGHRT